jgi:hypothetical protein
MRAIGSIQGAPAHSGAGGLHLFFKSFDFARGSFDLFCFVRVETRDRKHGNLLGPNLDSFFSLVWLRYPTAAVFFFSFLLPLTYPVLGDPSRPANL